MHSIAAPAVAECIEYSDYAHWISSLATENASFGVAVIGDIAYVAEAGYVYGGWSGLKVIDISDPEAPELLGSVEVPGYGKRVVVSGTYAFMTERRNPETEGRASGIWSGLQVIDISNPREPRIAGSLELPIDPAGLAVSGTYAYVANGIQGLGVIDVSNPKKPRMIGMVRPPSVNSRDRSLAAMDVAVSGGYAYVAFQDLWREGFLAVVDVADPANAHVVGVARGAGGHGVDVSGGRAYVVDEYWGFHVVDVTDPGNPHLVATAREGTGRSVVVSGDYAFAADQSSALRIIDISVPEDPLVSNVSSYCPQDVAVSAGYAYIAGYGAGLCVVYLGNFRAPPVLGGVTNLGRVVDIAVTGDYAYVPDSQGHLSIVDVSDPSDPQVVATLATPGEAVGIDVAGGYAFVSTRVPYDDSRVLAIDVSDPRNPRIVGIVRIPAWADRVVASGGHAYVRTGSALHVIDISDTANLWVVGQVSLPLFGHGGGLALMGSWALVAAGNDGLLVVDVNEPSSPTLVTSVALEGWVEGVATSDTHAYVTTTDLVVIDFADPPHPQVVGSEPLFNPGYSVAIAGEHAYVGGLAFSLEVIDIHDPVNPRKLGRTGCLEWIAYDVAVSGDCVYAAEYFSGFQILPTQCEAGRSIGSTRALGQRRESEADAASGPWIRALPNPAAGRTAIRLGLPVGAPVHVSVHDVAGRRIRTLFEGVAGSGSHDLLWDGSDDGGRQVAPGVYLARVSTNEGTRTARVVILR